MLFKDMFRLILLLLKTKGIFVAGDNRVKDVRQLVTATADGAVAATEAVHYINS